MFFITHISRWWAFAVQKVNFLVFIISSLSCLSAFWDSGIIVQNGLIDKIPLLLSVTGLFRRCVTAERQNTIPLESPSWSPYSRLWSGTVRERKRVMLVAQVVSRLSGRLETEGNVCTVWASLNLGALHSANYREAHLELQGPLFFPPPLVGLEQFWLKLPPEAHGQSLACSASVTRNDSHRAAGSLHCCHTWFQCLSRLYPFMQGCSTPP